MLELAIVVKLSFVKNKSCSSRSFKIFITYLTVRTIKKFQIYFLSNLLYMFLRAISSTNRHFRPFNSQRLQQKEPGIKAEKQPKSEKVRPLIKISHFSKKE